MVDELELFLIAEPIVEIEVYFDTFPSQAGPESTGLNSFMLLFRSWEKIL